MRVQGFVAWGSKPFGSTRALPKASGRLGVLGSVTLILPLADSAALLPLGSLLLPADLVCPILHLVRLPEDHGGRRRVRPRAGVRPCLAPCEEHPDTRFCS